MPPKFYGGTERVVSWLTEELIALGHEVTLFASGDSVTSGTLVFVTPRDWIHLPLLACLGLPHLTTIHNRLDTPDLPPVVRRFPDAPLISISDYHRTPLPSATWLGTVYHGMPAELLTPSYEPGGYLAFLPTDQGEGAGSCDPHRERIRHRIADGRQVPRAETRCYEERLQTLVDGENIKLIGELNDTPRVTSSGVLWRSSSRLTGPSRSDWS